MSRDLPDPPEYSLAGIRYELERLVDTVEKVAESEADEDHQTLVRIGGIPVGAAVAREVLENGRILYEVEPFPAWSGLPAQPRQEIQS